MSTAIPHLIFDNFSEESKIGQRFKKILQALYTIPKSDSKRVITFANNKDIISFRHHNYTKNKLNKIELKEIGPRFELRPYEIKIGTLEMNDITEKEWVFRPYMNTSKKQRIL
jgi:U3 small nucleolar ribonucleoprotein protein IMP4